MKYEIKQLNDTDAVVINSLETLSNNGDYFLGHPNYDKLFKWNMPEKTQHEGKQVWIKKVIATISPFKIEGLPMLELPNPAYDWFASKSYLEQHSLSDKYFESRNPSLLTNEQVAEMYKLELPIQEEDIKKLALDFAKTSILNHKEQDLNTEIWISGARQQGFIEGYKAAQKQYTEEDVINFTMNMIGQYVHGNTNIWNKELLKESLQSQQKKQFPIAVELTEDFKPKKWYYEKES